MKMVWWRVHRGSAHHNQKANETKQMDQRRQWSGLNLCPTWPKSILTPAGPNLGARQNYTHVSPGGDSGSFYLLLVVGQSTGAGPEPELIQTQWIISLVWLGDLSSLDFRLVLENEHKQQNISEPCHSECDAEQTGSLKEKIIRQTSTVGQKQHAFLFSPVRVLNCSASHSPL